MESSHNIKGCFCASPNRKQAGSAAHHIFSPKPANHMSLELKYWLQSQINHWLTWRTFAINSPWSRLTRWAVARSADSPWRDTPWRGLVSWWLVESPQQPSQCRFPCSLLAYMGCSQEGSTMLGLLCWIILVTLQNWDYRNQKIPKGSRW